MFWCLFHPCKAIEKIVDVFNQNLGLEEKINIRSENDGISVEYKGRSLRFSGRGKLVGVSNRPMELKMNQPVPEHMDKWHRNERLYETLKNMGLFVLPLHEKAAGGIDHFIVSTGVPDIQQDQGN
jgi:hypothetical protein